VSYFKKQKVGTLVLDELLALVVALDTDSNDVITVYELNAVFNPSVWFVIKARSETGVLHVPGDG
jgi:hypothetical protein